MDQLTEIENKLNKEEEKLTKAILSENDKPKVSKVPYLIGLISRILGIIFFVIGGYRLICLFIPIDVEIYATIISPIIIGYILICASKEFDWIYRCAKNPLATLESKWGGW